MIGTYPRLKDKNYTPVKNLDGELCNLRPIQRSRYSYGLDGRGFEAWCARDFLYPSIGQRVSFLAGRGVGHPPPFFRAEIDYF
jgi:hypothetical protein